MRCGTENSRSAAEMVSDKATRQAVGSVRPADELEPALQYKHRNMYEDERFTAPRTLFLVARCACDNSSLVQYSRFFIGAMVNLQAFSGEVLLIPPSRPQLRPLPCVDTGAFEQHISRTHGKHSEEYKGKVPYKLIPGIYWNVLASNNHARLCLSHPIFVAENSHIYVVLP